MLFPYLAQLIRKIFCVTATSCPSERLFSAAGNLVNQKRSCLLPGNVDKILFLYENLNESESHYYDVHDEEDDEWVTEA